MCAPCRNIRARPHLLQTLNEGRSPELSMIDDGREAMGSEYSISLMPTYLADITTEIARMKFFSRSARVARAQPVCALNERVATELVSAGVCQPGLSFNDLDIRRHPLRRVQQFHRRRRGQVI